MSYCFLSYCVLGGIELFSEKLNHSTDLRDVIFIFPELLLAVLMFGRLTGNLQNKTRNFVHCHININNYTSLCRFINDTGTFQ